MLLRKKPSFKTLFGALKTLNFYEESLIYLELFWGLDPRRQNLLSKLKFWVYFTVFSVFFLLCIAVPFTRWKGVETLGETDVTSPCYQVIFTIASYKLRQNSLEILLENLQEKFWKPISFKDDFKNSLRGINRKVTLFVYTYRTIIFLGITRYYVKPFLTNESLCTDWYAFCNLDKMICFVPSVIVQYYCLFVLVWSIYTFDGLFAGFLLKVIEQLRMIREKIKTVGLNEELQGNDVLKDLPSIVEHHSFVLEYIAQLNKFYSLILLSQFMSCVFSSCIGSFLLTANGAPNFEHLLNFVFYLAALFSQIFIYCYGGQVLLDECEAIIETVYNTNWWKSNTKVQKSILMIMVRSQKLGRLSLGGISDINLRTYLHASKTIFSFYTLMNQLYMKEIGDV